MEYVKYNFKTLIQEAANNKLVLPNFQRPYVWDITAQTQLLASFLVKLPIGTFLLLEGESDSFHSQELCFKNTAEPKQHECLFLLDGQQRMSTIKNIFYDHLSFSNWDKNIRDRELYPALQYRWFLSVENSPIDLLGFDTLYFDPNNTDNITNVEPGDVIDSIVKHKILLGKKDHDKFYHPASIRAEETAFSHRTRFIAECAAKRLIPLFHVIDNNNRIVKQTLEQIARLQVQALQDIVNNKTEKPSKYLGHLEPNIDSKYYDTTTYLKEAEALWKALEASWVDNVNEYLIDLFRDEIRVPKLKASELARATSVFEYMNKGGTPLDTFDIMVAKYANPKQDETLYSILHGILDTPHYVPLSVSKYSDPIKFKLTNFDVYKKGIVSRTVKDQYLNLIAIFHAVNQFGINKLSINHTKKDYLLKRKRSDIDAVLEKVNTAIIRALMFLQFRCGFDSLNRLNYKLMLLPIAYALQEDEVWNSKKAVDRVEFWYWSALFSGRYREKQNNRVIDDIKNIKRFAKGEEIEEITTRSKEMFNERKYNDLDALLHDGNDEASASAIQNGLLLFVLSREPYDFKEAKEKLVVWKLRNGHILAPEGEEDVEQEPRNIDLQDHHIVPIGSSRSLNESSRKIRKEKKIRMINSPLNRVLISAEANNLIGAMMFEDYSKEINDNVGWSQMIPKVPDDARTLARDEEKFRAFLSERFDLIQRKIQAHLDELVR